MLFIATVLSKIIPCMLKFFGAAKSSKQQNAVKLIIGKTIKNVENSCTLYVKFPFMDLTEIPENVLALSQ